MLSDAGMTNLGPALQWLAGELMIEQGQCHACFGQSQAYANVFMGYKCDAGTTSLGPALAVFSKGDAGRARQCHASVGTSQHI